MWAAPQVAWRPDGRLHLHHGPIDLIIAVWGTERQVRDAQDAAIAVFEPVLPTLCRERESLSRPVDGTTGVEGPVARAMVKAARRHKDVFVTPMAGVAGAVADHVLATMIATAPLARAYVNNGGDIACHVSPGESLTIAMANGGSLTVDRPCGIATSGRHGRSFSLGIADSVTVVARSAVEADIAATLIANAVDIDHPAIRRAPASTLDPDSDLGDRPVTTDVGALPPDAIRDALETGIRRARHQSARGLILGAALTLQGTTETVGSLPIQNRKAA